MDNYKTIYDAIQKEIDKAYQLGYDAGRRIHKNIREKDMNMGYQRGLDDAWKCARKILFDHSLPDTIKDLFNADTWSGVIKNASVSEAIEMIEKYEQRQTENLCDKCDFEECNQRMFIGKTTVCKEYEYRKQKQIEYDIKEDFDEETRTVRYTVEKKAIKEAAEHLKEESKGEAE